MSNKSYRVFNLLWILFLSVSLSYMTEKLDFPVEEFKKSNVFTDNAGSKFPVLVFVDVPVDVSPFGELNGLIVFVEVALCLFNALKEDDLEAGDAEEGHRDANF